MASCDMTLTPDGSFGWRIRARGWAHKPMPFTYWINRRRALERPAQAWLKALATGGRRHGNASGQVLPTPLRGAELHPGGREVQRGPAGPDARHQAAGGGVRRAAVP